MQSPERDCDQARNAALRVVLTTVPWQRRSYRAARFRSLCLATTRGEDAASRQANTRKRAEGDLRLHIGRTFQNIVTITFFGGQEHERANCEGFRSRRAQSRQQKADEKFLFMKMWTVV